MKSMRVAGGATQLTLEPKEVEILGLMIANEVVGEVGRGEPGLAEGILEVGSGEPYWGRPDITQFDAAEFSHVLLGALGGFEKAQEIIADSIATEISEGGTGG